MAENPYINKVEANNQTLIDLTSDTATASDVLAGRTLHLASGAPATGTYQPGDEIEARLESTVGHSCKNLLELTVNTDTNRGVTFTVDKTAGTISTSGTASSNYNAIFEIPIPSNVTGGLYMSGCADGGTSQTFYMEGYNKTDNVKLKNWSGASSVNCYNTAQSRQVTVPQGKSCVVRIVFIKNTNADGKVFRPMLRDGRISDDTFEPYVTPTDDRIVSLEARVAALEAALR